jgi:putative membrane protein insertion efficiency factor
MMRVLLWVSLVPRNCAIAMLLVYRKVISPLYGQVCRYHPSCSTYALHAIQYHGLVKGTALGSWRILRCNPWARGGIDDPPPGPRRVFEVLPVGFVGVKER